jgi:hypothetical protein
MKFDIDKKEFSILNMRVESDRFFYSNYSILDKKKKLIIMGREFIHEMDLIHDYKCKSIGKGYKEILEQYANSEE